MSGTSSLLSPVSNCPWKHCSALVAVSKRSFAVSSHSSPISAALEPSISSLVRSFSSVVPPTATATATATAAEDKSGQTARYAELIREIKTDLIEADVNHDGKIDAEELKIILRKHNTVFSDREILELSDLFYMGKGGAGVSHEDFLRGIAHVMKHDETAPGGGNGDEINEVEAANAAMHRRMETHTHPLGLGNCATEYMYGKNRGVYTPEELDVKLTHVEPVTTTDKVALFATRVVRFCFDTVSLWKFGDITKDKILRRVIFLETVAAIPGFVAAMVRHFKSVRTFTRDGGMLQMFLDEANNERMHLLSFVRLRDAGPFLRIFVLVSQTFIGAGFLLAYNISPAFCHRFVGYVEEEACHTYTDVIGAIESAPEGSDMAEWRTEKAPSIARSYWRLGEEGTVLDMVYAVRADEAEHRDVNHVCSGLKDGQQNPLYNPQAEFDQMLMKYVKDIMAREPNEEAVVSKPPA